MQKFTVECAKTLRAKCVEKYAEIATMGASAPVSSQQLLDLSTTLNEPLPNDTKKRKLLDVARNKKQRAEIKQFARKNVTSSEITPETKMILATVTASYKKPWSRKSAVILETLLDNPKQLKFETVEKPKPQRRTTKRAAKKTTAKKTA